MMSHLTMRRSFIKGGMAAPGVALSARAGQRAAGANDRVRLGLIGAGPRGQYIMATALKTGGAECVAVADVYDVRRRQAIGRAGGPLQEYVDYRDLLDRKDIDAVIVATPDHWHSQVTVDACLAGKDVYCEKPMTSRAEQGPAVVRAARRNGRVVAVGTQQRSGPHYQEAKQKYIDSGRLGKIGLVRTWYNANNGYTMVPSPGMEKQPEGLDWERWLGPLPRIPWDPHRYFSPFKWMDIGGGQVAGIFVHVLDTAHWFLNLTKPSRVVAGGGIYRYKDGRDTPDVINLILEYPQEVNITFEGEVLTCHEKYKASAGLELHGTGGVLAVHRYTPELGYEFTPTDGGPVERGKGQYAAADPHVKNWLDCIRSRQKPIADALDGHYAATACHMGNLAWKHRRAVEWDSSWDAD